MRRVKRTYNFDDSLNEPSVLPTKIPNLLVNGASGIAVGMPTNMAPHNLTEVINGTVAYIDNRKIENDEKNLNNLEIPIAISEVRQMKDRSGQQAMVIDVVVNPWCHQTASSNKIFKAIIPTKTTKTLEISFTLCGKKASI